VPLLWEQCVRALQAAFWQELGAAHAEEMVRAESDEA